jgi:hypothetical protein
MRAIPLVDEAGPVPACESAPIPNDIRVLIVSYYFPPTNAIGAQRCGKWAKYLPEHGVEPWVLTVSDGVVPTVGTVPLEIPLQQVIRAGLGPLLTNIVRRRRAAHSDADRPDMPRELGARRGSHRPWEVWQRVSRHFSDVRFPDRALPWLIPAAIAGYRTMRAARFDAILSSHGPPTSHIVAHLLARLHHVPWVADFRDPWSANHAHERGRLLGWAEALFEQLVLSRAAAISCSTRTFAQHFQELHGLPTHVIENGYDEDDYRFTRESDTRPPSERLHLTYTGTIYPAHQDVSRLFDALALIKSRAPHHYSSLVVNFVGSSREELIPLAQARAVLDCVRWHRKCARHESMMWQRSADINLIFEWHPVSTGVCPAKLYEYLGAGRPILAIGEQGGAIHDVLTRARAGRVIGNAADIADHILTHLNGHCPDSRPGNDVNLTPFTRRYQAGQIASLLRDVLHRHRGS